MAAVGEPLSFGNFVARAEGEDGPVTIQAIELIGVEGLHVVGVMVNGPGRNFGMVGAVPGYPPPEAQQDPLPLPGAVVPGGDATTRRRGLAVTFGVRRDAPGRGYATGFAVAYTVGGAEYRAEFRTGITLCAFEGYVRGTSPQPACESVEQPG